jgi:4-amino-4-deoxy-L-arabinose transferase-like glycosyltransferase
LSEQLLAPDNRAGERVRRQAAARWYPRPRLEALILVGLIALGAVVRLPDLQHLPKLSDEMWDALYSLSISKGQALPLANFTAYHGVVFNYLQAAIFRLVGSDPHLPRLLMLLAGLLGLPLVYLLGRRLGGPPVGLMAAAMLAVSPVHVLVNSRISWGNCLTPLFTTAGFWLLIRATSQPRPGERDPAWNLAPASLLFGLALQTHPTVFALLPGTALAVALARPGLLRSRWLLAGLLAFALGYANMIAFNLMNGLESLAYARRIQAAYGATDPGDDSSYLDNLGVLLGGLYRMVGGGAEDRDQLTAFLFDPAMLLVALLALVALFWSIRRHPLPLLATLSAVLLLPLVNDRYEPITDGRYLAPLLPLLFVSVAGLLVDLWRWPIAGQRPLWRGVAVAGLAATLLVPPLGIARYAEQNEAAARRSARLWRSLELAEQRLPPGTSAIVDRDLEHAWLGAGSTELLFFEHGLSMLGRPYRIVRVSPGNVLEAIEAEPGRGPRLLVAERRKARLLEQRLKVQPVDAHLDEQGVQPFVYGVYLVRPESERRS